MICGFEHQMSGLVTEKSQQNAPGQSLHDRRNRAHQRAYVERLREAGHKPVRLDLSPGTVRLIEQLTGGRDSRRSVVMRAVEFALQHPDFLEEAKAK